MSNSNNISYCLSSLEYTLGTLISRVLLRSVGSCSQLHFSIKYWHPGRISIGANCEVRHGTFFDARSSKEVSIRVGDGCRIKDFVGFATYGGEIQLGENVLVGRCSTIFGHGGVYIGDYTMIGPNTLIVSSDHIAYLSDIPFQQQGFTREAIQIGSNVWIGGNAYILAGTRIASNVVVAAGSVVQGTLPSGWLYAGIPAKPLRQLDKDKQDNVQVYSRNWGLLD